MDSRRLAAVLMLVPAVALALAAAWSLQYPARRSLEAIDFPYQLDAEEGFLLGQAGRLARGEGMYPSIHRPPYVVDNYPPLYPMLWRLAGGAAPASLAPGRWLAAGGALLAALALGVALVLARGRPGGWFEGALSGCFALAAAGWFLSSYAAIRWVGYARVDLPALGLSLAGLAALLGGGLAAGGRRAALARGAALLGFALALWTKQTMLAAPAAACLVLLTRQPRTGLRFGLLLAAALLLPLGLLLALTGGEYWRHTVAYNRNVMVFHELPGWLAHLWRFYPGRSVALLAATLLYLARLPRLRPWRADAAPGDAARWLVFLYFVMSMAELPTLAKAGAAENYLLGPHAGAALWLGLCAADAFAAAVRAWPHGGRARAGALAAALALLAPLAWQENVRVLRDQRPSRLAFLSAPRPNPRAEAVGNTIVARLRRLEPGPALAEDPIYLIRAGRRIYFQNFIMTQLAAEGRWDPAPLVEAARAGEFPLIQAHKDLADTAQFFNRWPPALRRAIVENYRREAVLKRPPLQDVFLYRPAP